MTDEQHQSHGRRSFIKAAGVGVVAGLAGCTRGGTQSAGGANGSGGNGSNGSGGSGNLPVSLDRYNQANVEWDQFDGDSINVGAVQHPWVDAIRPAIPVFEELTGITVQWNVLPEEEFRTKRLTDVSTGAGQFDAFFLDQVVNQFRQSGWLQALDPYFNDSSLFDENWYNTNDILEVCREAGHGAGLADTWTGIPITVEVLTTFYRTDLYEKHDLSVPQTVTQLRNNARVIQENEDIVGAVGRGQKGYGMNVYVMNGWIREYGPSLWESYPDDSGLDTEEAITAGNAYVGLLREYGPSGASSQAWSDALSTMQSGQAGHFLTDANLFWGNLTDPEASDIADNVGIAKMAVPETNNSRFAPNSFTWQLSTSKNASNSEQAFLFMTWATSQPTMEYMHVQGGAPFPVRDSIWSNNEFRSAVGENFASVSQESLRNAVGDPFDPQYPEWAQAYSEELQTAIAGSQSVEQAFRTAANRAQNIASQ